VSGELIRDLDEIVDAAADDLRRFTGARMYVTGGTGFVGAWLLRAIVHANRRLGTKIRVDALTRSPEAAADRAPDLAADPAIRFLRGDVLAPVVDGAYDAVVHAATPSSTPRDEALSEATMSVIVDGIRAVIRVVIEPSGAVPVLFTSSGAVYGRQPPDVQLLPEDYAGAPDVLDPRSAYDEGKRFSELALALAQSRGAGKARVARLFSFMGPGMHLDAHFAAGNFVRDALAGGPIRIAGDGTPLRSYLYPTDLVTWCLAIFARGLDARAYNVGSADEISIRELAETVARAAGGLKIEQRLAPSRGNPERYVPDVRRITSELGVSQSVSVVEAATRTLGSYAP